MKDAALGIQMHSGWGVAVAVSGDAGSPEIVDRQRIVTADSAIPGAIQPYHHAARLELAESQNYLATCTAASSQLAAAAIRDLVTQLHRRDYRIEGAVILMASGRPLPPLPKILASHPLIHTAEGEFFRNTARKGCEALQIPVTAMRDRDLPKHADAVLGNASGRVQSAIAGMGASIGPPWTKDHKTAALAAALLLRRGAPDRRLLSRNGPDVQV